MEESSIHGRELRFEAIDNFRDYGGYAAAGGQLRKNWLYRSAHHVEATAPDLAAVSALGLSVVIDLRGPNERAKSPMPWPKEFGGRIFETPVETSGVAPHIEAAARAMSSVSEAEDVMAALYAEMPSRPVIISVLRAYFAMLAETDGPSLIHCAAGKDRTGVAVSLLHTLLGVHHDDVMADYLLTNTIGRAEERIARGVVRMRQYRERLSEEAARVLVLVAPRYLDAAHGAIVTQYGSVETYLRDEIEVTTAVRDRLAERLVV